MPNLNGTGPFGEGPMTGRGMGYCSGNLTKSSTNLSNNFNFGFGRGIGRGNGRGRGRGLRCGRGFGFGAGRFAYPTFNTQFTGQQTNSTSTSDNEKNLLKNKLNELNAEVETIKKRINELNN